MRELIIEAIAAELYAQSEGAREGEHPAHAPYVRTNEVLDGARSMLVDGDVDLGRLADAIAAALIEHVPTPGGELIKRLSAIADRMEGALAGKATGGVLPKGKLYGLVGEGGPVVIKPGDAFTKHEPEPAIECTPAEREALKHVRGMSGGFMDTIHRYPTALGVELSGLARLGLVEVARQRGLWRWTVTPLGLRAIEQEPL